MKVVSARLTAVTWKSSSPRTGARKPTVIVGLEGIVVSVEKILHQNDPGRQRWQTMSMTAKSLVHSPCDAAPTMIKTIEPEEDRGQW